MIIVASQRALQLQTADERNVCCLQMAAKSLTRVKSPSVWATKCCGLRSWLLTGCHNENEERVCHILWQSIQYLLRRFIKSQKCQPAAGSEEKVRCSLKSGGCILWVP